VSELHEGSLLVDLMQRASVLVGVNPRPRPRDEVETILSSDRDRAHIAVDALLAGGFLREDDEGRLRSVKPFRAAEQVPAEPEAPMTDELQPAAPPPPVRSAGGSARRRFWQRHRIGPR